MPYGHDGAEIVLGEARVYTIFQFSFLVNFTWLATPPPPLIRHAHHAWIPACFYVPTWRARRLEVCGHRCRLDMPFRYGTVPVHSAGQCGSAGKSAQAYFMPHRAHFTSESRGASPAVGCAVKEANQK